MPPDAVACLTRHIAHLRGRGSSTRMRCWVSWARAPTPIIVLFFTPLYVMRDAVLMHATAALDGHMECLKASVGVDAAGVTTLVTYAWGVRARVEHNRRFVDRASVAMWGHIAQALHAEGAGVPALGAAASPAMAADVQQLMVRGCSSVNEFNVACVAAVAGLLQPSLLEKATLASCYPVGSDELVLKFTAPTGLDFRVLQRMAGALYTWASRSAAPTAAAVGLPPFVRWVLRPFGVRDEATHVDFIVMLRAAREGPQPRGLKRARDDEDTTTPSGDAARGAPSTARRPIKRTRGTMRMTAVNPALWGGV